MLLNTTRWNATELFLEASLPDYQIEMIMLVLDFLVLANLLSSSLHFLFLHSFLEMPGTIQVFSSGFRGSPIIITNISKSFCGENRLTEYHTCDKGELSCVETLCDNLILTLQGDEGNEISRTGIEIRLVVQRGVWDDIFSVEGGGHVHMKLQFLLSEEEHQRIWMMVDADVGTAAEANANGKTSQNVKTTVREFRGSSRLYRTCWTGD